ncbi:hypothetical protein [Litorihabitans aurantiacus]|uniref:DUF998 domain-containing protein n=1 Tax=Litorihabitans aurantiacus TaxID=1930061 RepID=A0AA37XHX8_9MICO|nr:hypothetical protein [Litorihabitans aurantiacus]GMA30074.1 hypothetical protein GCM10025875_00660 [Litorihabitans aurantiacus]GMA33573.1 hypothetical protein GCM10025875_35650 [Litorihabitans aurantiacus]
MNGATRSGAGSGAADSPDRRAASSTTASSAPPTLDTYRALRVGLVGAGLLLLTGVGVEIARVGVIPGSISATFYSPVRGVLVGSLIAVGLALLAIKGRPGWEDGLLDVAGMLVPLVGLVPTPVVLASIPGGEWLPVSCPDVEVACVPVEVEPDVANNVSAYLLVGLATLVLVGVRAVRARARGRAWRAGSERAVAIAVGLWAITTAWFLLGRASFLAYAHYASAITFFALLVAVVWINARRASPPPRPRRMGERGYRRSYLAIGVAMGASVVAGLVVWLAVGDDDAFPLVFWIEVVLLLLYTAFWILQTVEHWRDGEVEEE